MNKNKIPQSEYSPRVEFWDRVWLVMKAGGIIPWNSKGDEFTKIVVEMIEDMNIQLLVIMKEALDNKEEIKLAYWCNETAVVTDLKPTFWEQDYWSTSNEYQHALAFASESKYVNPLYREDVTKILKDYKKENRVGYIYVLKGQDGYYKIGTALNVDERIGNFSPKLPFPVEVIFYKMVENRFQVEKMLHDRFQDKHTNGEWFRLDSNDIKIIEALVPNEASVSL
jgi:hypothetical protein